MAGGELNVVPIAVSTAASAVTVLVGIRLQRQVTPLLCAVACALAGAAWYVRTAEVGIWFASERAFRGELVSAALPALATGLLVLLPSGLGARTRSLLTIVAAVVLVAAWPVVLLLVTGAP